MKLLCITILSLYSAFAFAGGDSPTCDNLTPAPKKVVRVPKLKKPVVKEVVVAPAPETKQKQKQDSYSNSNAQQKQSINLNLNFPKASKYRLTEKSSVAHKNMVLFLVGISNTKLAAERTDCCSVAVKKSYEPDFGIMLARDFDGFVAGLVGTKSEAVYVGFGFSF